MGKSPEKRVHRDKYSPNQEDQGESHATHRIRERGRNVARKIVEMPGQDISDSKGDVEETLVFLRTTEPALPRKHTTRAIKRN